MEHIPQAERQVWVRVPLECPHVEGVQVEEESEQAQLAPELEVQLGMDNYKTISLCTMTTRGQAGVGSPGGEGLCRHAEAREHFHRATLSRLALITKVKDRGEDEGHIDLLRSGGNMCRRESSCRALQTWSPP